MKYTVLTVLLLITFSSCQENITNFEVFDAEAIHQANQKLIEISIEDIYSPPVATRVFAYPNLAAYEVFSHGKGQSVIENFKQGLVQPTYKDTMSIDYSLAAMHAFALMAKKMVFSEYLADSIDHHFTTRAKELGVSDTRIASSKAYAVKICGQLEPWYDEDMYAQVKADDLYTIRGHDSTWVLTPPNYEPALEPNWKKLRPLVLDDVKNFQPKPRPPFSTDKNSIFYKEAMNVYNQDKMNQESNRSIAKHWDCNPNEFVQKGHNVAFNHRISPPGHWVGLTKTVCDIKKADLYTAMKAYAATTVAMFDGIIACWHTKYKEELIRPVTYINRYIDNTWQPYIQTPPFPEFTSGHSVVSGCSSSILDYMFPNTPFVDYTEVQFGLPSRSFKSFHDAGEEASLSRYYGGIHYKFGIDNGLEQGRNIGKHILSKMN